MLLREEVACEVDDEGAILFAVERTPAGRLSGRVRVWGRVTIDGKSYEYDRDELRVSLRPVKEAGRAD